MAKEQEKVDPVTSDVPPAQTAPGADPLVAVQFLRPWKQYRADEIAGFNAELAQGLIDRQFAKAYQ